MKPTMISKVSPPFYKVNREASFYGILEYDSNYIMPFMVNYMTTSLDLINPVE